MLKENQEGVTMHPFYKLARMLLDEALNAAGSLRGKQLTDEEKALLHADFDRIVVAMANVMSMLPTEHILLLFPEHMRGKIAGTVALARYVYDLFQRYGNP